MLHPRSELQIFAVLDSLCEVVRCPYSKHQRQSRNSSPEGNKLLDRAITCCGALPFSALL